MEYRKAARGDSVSTIGIGSSNMHEISPGGIRELVDYATEQGVNLFDLAMSYPEALDYIGAALKGKRDRFLLQLHLGLTFPDGQYVRTRDLSRVKKGFEKQLKSLETDYIDFGFIHYVDESKDLEDAIEYYTATKEERDYSFVSGLQPRDMRGICVYCNHCLPCPAGIDIGSVHKYLDLYLAGDLLAREHYLALDKRAVDCIGCGSCERNCSFEVKVISKMKQAAGVME